MRLYKEVKEITGQVPASEIFRRCMKEYLEKRRVAKRKAKSSPESKRRFIPKSVKIDVLKRDGKQCTFVTPDGKRCAEKHALQFDHVTPYAAGGSNASGNLRLLCKAHNLLMAEKYFGKDKMMNSRANSIV